MAVSARGGGGAQDTRSPTARPPQPGWSQSAEHRPRGSKPDITFLYYIQQVTFIFMSDVPDIKQTVILKLGASQHYDIANL